VQAGADWATIGRGRNVVAVATLMTSLCDLSGRALIVAAGANLPSSVAAFFLRPAVS